ncbi:hypothetical protein D3C73_1043720 [compost metagenome]
MPAIRETGLVVLSWDVYFPRVQDMFDSEGLILPEFAERYEGNLTKLYAELIWFARLLKNGRERI